MRKRPIPLALAALLAVLLAGCAAQSGEKAPITDIRQLDGQTIGVMTGSTFDQHTDTYINDAKKEYYASYADMALAAEQGKIAGFLMDEPMARVLCAENPGVTYLEDYLTEDGYAFAFPKTEKGALLRDQMNEFLTQIQADGTLEEIEEIWFGTDESVQVVEDWTALPAPNGTLEFAAKASSAPFAYVKDNKTVGYDVDIVVRFCKAYGYGLNLHNVELTSFIAGIEAGKYDLGAAGFTVTEERKERVYFSQPDYSGGIVVVVANQGQDTARFESLADFEGAPLGALTGSYLDQLAQQAIPGVTIQYYDDIASMLLAVQNGYVDGALLDMPLATLAVARQRSLAIFPETLAPDSYGLGLPKGSPLTPQVSAIIEGYQADGTLDALADKWLGADEAAKTIDVG
ncbi:substrate-binding periplasmic protein, partial [uncultured Flavonifractor sp.]|uniref:substrate-binding periplasmic protein n=1 Tax=uncultured Flavonifractor sp. TaxID=1193534 RepID=UPI0026155004